ncbi:hypothetical protein ACQP04_28125 [Pseudonocardia halophobica]|uniref:hypothetical protein n=1 Tax=Pseudonocardia halophobica TaxID=29401 RepID=UPI003D8D3649
MASIKRRPNGSWRARYRDADGREHARHFPRKIDAQAWLDEVTAAVVTGRYVDPRAGRVTLDDFYRDWSGRQVWVPSTATSSALALRDSGLGPMPIGSIRRSHVEGWSRR